MEGEGGSYGSKVVKDASGEGSGLIGTGQLLTARAAKRYQGKASLTMTKKPSMTFGG